MARPRPSDETTSQAGEGARGQRLWRMRKRHHTVDAELWSVSVHTEAAELRYAFNGELTFRRTWPSRDDAVREAMMKRAELERDGWVFHW